MPESSYTVFARRYRPSAFDEVVGQEHVATTLKNAITENRVGHAYLFSGPRGVGKTSMARIFARALNCEKGPTLEPCGTCEICTLIHEGRDSDVIEMDAASNRGVDDARALREGVRYAPLRARCKVYIIDEAHMLTREAFNTLLKTLEEPPPHVKFILATTEIHKFPDTITSRCQRFEFRRITTRDIAKRLGQIAGGEKITVNKDVLGAVARAGRGSMRDAQSVLDQLIAFKDKGLTRSDVTSLLGTAADDELIAFVDGVSKADPKAVLESLDRVFAAGVDGTAFLDQLLEHLRSLLLIRACGKDAAVVDLPDSELEHAAKQAEPFSLETLLYAIQLALDTRRRVREGADPRLVLEVTGVKLARIGDLVSVADALKTLEAGPAPARAAPSKASPFAPAAEDERPPLPDDRPKPAPTGDKWDQVIARVREASLVAGTLLGQGQVSHQGREKIEFILPAKFKTFNIDKLKDAKNLVIIEDVIAKVYGKRLKFEATLDKDGGGSGGGGTAEARPSANLTSDPGVKKVLDAFPGSKIVGIE